MNPSLGNVAINLTRLLETRLLIQSNSGGGKSFCLRRVLEQTVAHVQQLVIDPEGEFSTLRERHDYIVCAPLGADAVANPQTAAALALALWQAGTSAVLDIYELKAHERILFVRRFLEALVNAPRQLWHPTLVVIDEIHVFAPQGDRAESLAAVIDLATRGRKRGLALLGATQRISKLHKDCAAELLNKAIGRTGLDVDVRRAADELGMPVKEATETLRNLEPGEFFVFGPALTRAVERTKIGPVQTTHPETGKRALIAPPPASPKIRAQLAKIEGLQRDAEDEARTSETLTQELAKVRRELAAARQSQPGPAGIPIDEVERRNRESAKAGYDQGFARGRQEVSIVVKQCFEMVSNAIQGATNVIDSYEAPRPANPAAEIQSDAPQGVIQIKSPYPRSQKKDSKPAVATKVHGSLTKPEQRIVDSLAWWAAAGVARPTRHQVAFVAGYTVNGHFNNQVGTLKAPRGMVEYPGNGTLSLTDLGVDHANKPQTKPSRDDLVYRVTNVLKGEPMRRVFLHLVKTSRPLTREALAEACGYTVNGHFNNIVGALNGIGVADYPAKGQVGLTSIFAL